ncbi:hypothetical protein HGB24_00135 [Candidatus Saccharibacteria bacterium]|nr:hypothetical protein [Candidatus Saccharibacteria bacterium]
MLKVFYISSVVTVKTNKSKKNVASIIKRTHHNIRMAVVPHGKNQYRPHLIRSYGIIAIIFVVIGLQFGYRFATTGSVLGSETSITINSLLDATNAERIKAGEEPLALNAKLDQAAYLKVQNMFEAQYWSHIAPDGTPPWKWLGDVGYNYDEAGENLARNFTTTDSVMTAWMNSVEHRRNILNADYQDIGFAIMSGSLDNKPVSIIVVMFGRSADNVIANANKSFSEASVNGVNIFTQFAVSLQSINPATSAGLLLIAFAIVVAAYAHRYRDKLPKAIKRSWRRHHGLYKSIGMLVFGLIVIVMFGGGQI